MSIGAIKRQTKNFLFNIINFDFARWHRFEHENWDLIDAILSVYISSGGLKGIWKNSTIYSVSDRVIDPDSSDLWLVLVPHTSGAEPQTFASYRAANPTHWRSITYDPKNRGAWTGPGTVYGVNDFITSGLRYGVSDKDFVSGISYDADVVAGNITTLIDLDPTTHNHDSRYYTETEINDMAFAISKITGLQTALNALDTEIDTKAATADVLLKSDNLASVASPAIARTNLGLSRNIVTIGSGGATSFDQAWQTGALICKITAMGRGSGWTLVYRIDFGAGFLAGALDYLNGSRYWNGIAADSPSAGTNASFGSLGLTSDSPAVAQIVDATITQGAALVAVTHKSHASAWGSGVGERHIIRSGRVGTNGIATAIRITVDTGTIPEGSRIVFDWM